MNKFFTNLLVLFFLSFSLFAQQKKSGKSSIGKIYIKKTSLKPTVQKTSNLPAPSIYRNVEKPINFNGQWKGGFVDNSTSFIGIGGDRIDYVLELESQGSEVSGYSYTYFTESGKRFYTICKLRGTINRTTKEVVITEFERTKYNTPPNFSNCFQTHKLKYAKESSDTEMLQGTWMPAPNQDGNCGYGKTTLFKKIIKSDLALNSKLSKERPIKNINNQQQKSNTTQTNPPVKIQSNKTIVTTKPTVVKNNSTGKNNNEVKKPNSQLPPKKDTIKKETTIVTQPYKKTEPVIAPNLKFENRVNSVLKTISIKNETFTVDFYDNGEIDGDSISVSFNGKLVLSHKRLSEKPITLTLTIDTDRAINEVVMYAENLGEIPPNTALMIVHDGESRYETRIESDLGKNGTIRFTYNPKRLP